MPASLRNFLVLLLFVLLSEAAGIAGSLFSTSGIDGWYALLHKPELAPPNWVFGPVWTILYFLMGMAAFLVWKEGKDRRLVRISLGVFVFHLVLNTLWSIIFFTLQNPGAAFVEIIFLWLSIAAVIGLFNRSSKKAALLFIPYIAWVSFAAYLNYMFWILN